MRILFPLHGFIGWNGGIDLVRLLTAAMATQLGPDVELHFALPNSTLKRGWLLSALRRWRRLRAGVSTRSEQDTGSASALRRLACELIGGHPTISCDQGAAGILDAAARIRADIIFPTMFPLGPSGPPRVGYLFDFQHRRLPHLFPPRTIRNRNKQFARIVEDADAIVVNSRTVATEAAQFLGVTSEHLLVLPFTPYAQPWWFESPVDEVLTRHSISSPYFLICNHFWAHKDHATALRAFSLLLKSHGGAAIEMVLTGDPVDHRDPCHYANLIALTRELGIEDRIHSLGLIPKRDQIALMRGCQALIQPTLFEGGPGGGSVYEAVGLGIPVIVSDIPINREIDIGRVAFFRAGDPHSLAEQMAHAINPTSAMETSSELLKASDQRLAKLGAHIINHLAHLAV